MAERRSGSCELDIDITHFKAEPVDSQLLVAPNAHEFKHCQGLGTLLVPELPHVFSSPDEAVLPDVGDV